jgi:hypothetical protein
MEEGKAGQAVQVLKELPEGRSDPSTGQQGILLFIAKVPMMLEA